MKKYIILSPVIAFVLFLALNFNSDTVKAQVNAMCPAGYTCTRIPNVPNCPAGYFCVETIPRTVTSGSGSNTTTALNISTKIISNNLTLSYDGVGEQANLNARIAFTVNGGSKGVYIFKDTVGVDFIDQNGLSYGLSNQTRTLEAVSKVSSRTNVNGLDFFYVEPGTNTNFVINSSVPVNNLFAGSYRARALYLYAISDESVKDLGYYAFTPNSSVAVAVVGEKGPYIKSVTNVSKSGDRVVVKGERLDGKRGDVISLLIDGVNSGLGFSTSANGQEITFNLPRNISNGRHTLEVSSSVKGKSNVSGFVVGSESQPTIVSVSAYLADSNSDKAGIWDNFGPGVGNGNKNKNDWHWIVSLRKNNNEVKKIKSITVTHSGYEGWSTASEKVFGTKPYPLVVESNQNTTFPVNRLTKYVDDDKGVSAAFSNTYSSLDLYGQAETKVWNGGRVIVKFTDGTEASADIPASAVSASATTVKPATVSTVSPSPSSSPSTQVLTTAIVSPVNNAIVNVGNVIFVGEAKGGTGSYKYMWNFGDGSPVSDGRLINGASEKIYHNFTKEGIFTVKLYVVDANTGSISNTSSTQVKVQASAISSVSSTLPAVPPATTVQIPSITSIYPTTSRVGNDVTLTGKGFDLVNSYDIYLENSKGAAINPIVKYKRADSMMFTIPPMPAGIYKLYMVGRDGNSNSVNITITSTSGASVFNALNWMTSIFK